MSTTPDLLKHLGGVPVSSFVGNIGFGGGDVYWVDGNGDTVSDATSQDAAVKHVRRAYDQTTNNNNDIVIVIGNNSSVQLGDSDDSDVLNWSNSYTHCIGAGAPTRMSKRSRIFHNFDVDKIWTIAGDGCAFENFYFSHGRGSTKNLTAFELTGDRNYFGNLHIMGPANATEAGEATYDMIDITSGSQEHTFDDCVFGSPNTAMNANGITLINIDGGKYTFIRNCDFLTQATNTGATFMTVGSSGQFFLVLENVAMINSGTSDMTQAIDSNIADTTNCKIIIKPPFFTVGCTDVADATGDGTIWTQSFTSTANVLGLGVNVAAA